MKSDSIYSLAKTNMSGGDHDKPKKHVREVRVRKGHSGGHIVEHHHTHPEEYPMEEHVMPNMAALQEHMAATMGDGDGDEATAAPVQTAQPTAPVQAA